MSENELDPQRRFTGAQRSALILAADGRCEHCGRPLTDGFDADHLHPHSQGGRTVMANGAAACAHCNRSRKDSVMTITTNRAPLRPVDPGLKLRPWQEKVIPKMLDHEGRSFLLHVAPGGGKTIPALVAGRAMIERGEIDRIVVVAPTANLTRQWARAAHLIGLNLTPNWNGHREPADQHGIAITYARVRHGALALAAGCRSRTLVIADELHHLGEQRSWAQAFQVAFENAPKWLLLSGTPFRSDDRPIPGVHYDADGEAVSDFTYGYADAIADGVCRRTSFVFYDGQMRWISDGTRVEADFTVALDKRESSRRHRTCISPHLSNGLTSLIRDAYAKLVEVREQHADAGMLIVCESIEHAQAALKIAEGIIGQTPVLVTSDDPEATRRLEQFKDSTAPCMVAVNMVSEGVDIPRLRVGVYATPKKTPMLFRQITGRFVRTGSGPDNECSYLYMPKDPVLSQHAAEIEREIAHRLPDPDELETPPDERNEQEPGEQADTEIMFVPLAADVTAQGALLSGTRVDPGEASAIDQLARKRGITPDEVVRLLDGNKAAVIPEVQDDRPAFEIAEGFRKNRKRLVAHLHHLTKRDYPEINAQVNQATSNGRSVKDATLEELRAGNEMLELLIERVTGPNKDQMAS